MSDSITNFVPMLEDIKEEFIFWRENPGNR